MNVYDDAEIAAVEAVRQAQAEDEDGRTRSAEIIAIALRMNERHGWTGVVSLIAALARWNATAFRVLAEQEGKTAEQFIDEWEMHKLTQHVEDAEQS